MRRNTKQIADPFGFISAINTSARSAKFRNIIATFCDGRRADYTDRILADLKQDPSVVDIIDAQTGEVLYIKRA